MVSAELSNLRAQLLTNGANVENHRSIPALRAHLTMACETALLESFDIALTARDSTVKQPPGEVKRDLKILDQASTRKAISIIKEAAKYVFKEASAAAPQSGQTEANPDHTGGYPWLASLNPADFAQGSDIAVKLQRDPAVSQRNLDGLGFLADNGTEVAAAAIKALKYFLEGGRSVERSGGKDLLEESFSPKLRESAVSLPTYDIPPALAAERMTRITEIFGRMEELLERQRESKANLDIPDVHGVSFGISGHSDFLITHDSEIYSLFNQYVDFIDKKLAIGLDLAKLTTGGPEVSEVKKAVVNILLEKGLGFNSETAESPVFDPYYVIGLAITRSKKPEAGSASHAKGYISMTLDDLGLEHLREFSDYLVKLKS